MTRSEMPSLRRRKLRTCSVNRGCGTHERSSNPGSTPEAGSLLTGTLSPVNMYLLIQSYLERLPAAVKEIEKLDGIPARSCVYTPHSRRPRLRLCSSMPTWTYPEGPGSSRAPAHHHDANLRQAEAIHVGECLARRTDLSPTRRIGQNNSGRSLSKPRSQ
jgi:hypothetical protein